jgi:CBS domain-containing protein
MPQNIRDVMTSNPCTIDAEKSVAYAAKMMQEEDVGLAPIVEGDKLIGMLTDRDIATRVAAEGRNPDQVKVRDVASKQLITIDPQQDLDEALRMMAKYQVRRLPVVEEDGRLVGVVAQADIARKGDDTQTGQLVEEISQSGGQMSSFGEVQFPRQVEEEQPQESLVGQEPQVEEQQEDEAISKVQSSSRGRRKRSTSKRKTAARKSTGTRKRKTASRKRTTGGRTTVRAAGRKGGRKAAAKKRSTAKRKTTSRKRSTAKRSTTKRRSAAKKRSTTKRRSTAKRKTTSRKRSTTKRKTTSRKRSTGARKAAGTRKRKTATRKTAGRKAATTRKRKTATRKTAGRKAAATRKRKTGTRRRTTRRKTTR